MELLATTAENEEVLPNPQETLEPIHKEPVSMQIILKLVLCKVLKKWNYKPLIITERATFFSARLVQSWWSYAKYYSTVITDMYSQPHIPIHDKMLEFSLIIKQHIYFFLLSTFLQLKLSNRFNTPLLS